MSTAKQHSPVILLLGERTKGQYSVDDWLAASRYSACEAADVFHVLEQVSDFTQRDRPDVIFLHLDSVFRDREFLETLIATSVNEPNVPIIDFADAPGSTERETFEKAIAGLTCKLDEYIPKRTAARA